MKLEEYNPIDLFDILTGGELTNISYKHREEIKNDTNWVFKQYHDVGHYSHFYTLMVDIYHDNIRLSFIQRRIYNMSYDGFEREPHNESYFKYSKFFNKKDVDIFIREHNFKQLYN